MRVQVQVAGGGRSFGIESKHVGTATGLGSQLPSHCNDVAVTRKAVQGPHGPSA